MSKEYKNYLDVPKKYKYDLEFLLQGQTIEELEEQYFSIIKQLIKIKDSKYNNSKEYINALKLEEKSERLYFRLSNYISNTLSVNISDPKMNSFSNKHIFKNQKLIEELGSEDTRFFKNIKKIKEWSTQPEFTNYKKFIQEKIEDKKHILPKEIQEFRQKESMADVSTENIFSIITNSELYLGFALNSKGKKIKVTHANKMILSKHKDPKVRKTSHIAYVNGYLNHKQSLSNILFQHFKKTTVWSKIQKFDNTIESLLYGDRIPEKMLLNLYESVQQNIGLFKKYNTNWNKYYKIKFKKNPTKYDKNVDLVSIKNKYTPEESMKEVIDAFKPFGKEYLDIVKKAFKENWVDFMPVKNKRTGAYSIGGTYGIDKKLINMNFDGELRSVETLAHEMGHSMHSYFSDKNQPQALSQYPIFLAEIASIFNELILFDNMLKKSNDDKFKFKILSSIISGFHATVVRQTMWSNYEFDLYKTIEKGESASTFEDISKIYYKNSQKYSNKKNKFKQEDNWASIMVPHYYYNFYVYKYAIGQLCANIFFQKYKQNGVKELQIYINKFLSSGDRDWPLNILKDAGIDLMNSKSYEIGFKAVKENIDKWIKLGNKIFKIN